ncbi:MAG TPA: NAD-dependent epimerase/dehydratase family protein [Candidatus Sulfotelmatobacter sp.]|nr:NAD-dependent epimerase/dehydratase family protein [Candidatus Sulfotelmatobacter sp.]
MRWLITGGAGFIGCNAARRLAAEGHDVVVLDNLSRKGATENLAWLRRHGPVTSVFADVKDFRHLKRILGLRFDVVLHLAAQVAVTTSVLDPRADFEANALGTFNVCEAVRLCCPEAILLNASTNKVYGGMEDVRVVEAEGRYRYADYPQGISEARCLDFHSPYGCSKGAGDQYVRDYARIYGLRTVTFRQSCIYGTRQFGVEDQGWVAWFTIAAALGLPLTIYGDGKQVRDVLYVDDLIDCYLRAVERIDRVSGRAYNIGGGPSHTLSLLELLRHLERLSGRPIPRQFADWRPGDQPVFVCDLTRAEAELGWSPKTSVEEGVARLWAWVIANRELFEGAPAGTPEAAGVRG